MNTTFADPTVFSEREPPLLWPIMGQVCEPQFERDLEAQIATILREFINDGLEIGYGLRDLTNIIQNIFIFMLRRARDRRFPFSHDFNNFPD